MNFAQIFAAIPQALKARQALQSPEGTVGTPGIDATPLFQSPGDPVGGALFLAGLANSIANHQAQSQPHMNFDVPSSDPGVPMMQDARHYYDIADQAYGRARGMSAPTPTEPMGRRDLLPLLLGGLASKLFFHGTDRDLADFGGGYINTKQSEADRIDKRNMDLFKTQQSQADALGDQYSQRGKEYANQANQATDNWRADKQFAANTAYQNSLLAQQAQSHRDSVLNQARDDFNNGKTPGSIGLAGQKLVQMGELKPQDVSDQIRSMSAKVVSDFYRDQRADMGVVGYLSPEMAATYAARKAELEKTWQVPPSQLRVYTEQSIPYFKAQEWAENLHDNMDLKQKQALQNSIFRGQQLAIQQARLDNDRARIGIQGFNADTSRMNANWRAWSLQMKGLYGGNDSMMKRRDTLANQLADTEAKIAAFQAYGQSNPIDTLDPKIQAKRNEEGRKLVMDQTRLKIELENIDLAAAADERHNQANGPIATPSTPPNNWASSSNGSMPPPPNKQATSTHDPSGGSYQGTGINKTGSFEPLKPGGSVGGLPVTSNMVPSVSGATVAGVMAGVAGSQHAPPKKTDKKKVTTKAGVTFERSK